MAATGHHARNQRLAGATALGRTSPFRIEGRKVPIRRVSPIAARSASVSFLSPQLALSLGGGNRSSCPLKVIFTSCAVCSLYRARFNYTNGASGRDHSSKLEPRRSEQILESRSGPHAAAVASIYAEHDQVPANRGTHSRAGSEIGDRGIGGLPKPPRTAIRQPRQRP